MKIRHALGMVTHLGLMAVTLAALTFPLAGCAAYHGPEGWAFGVGADAAVTVYGDLQPPTNPSEISSPPVVEVREQSIDRTFPARDETRKTTLTTPAQVVVAEASCEPPKRLELEGSAFLEPLAKVIGEVMVGIGKAGGCAVLKVITFGFGSCT